jgi:hypothetical protein
MHALQIAAIGVAVLMGSPSPQELESANRHHFFAPRLVAHLNGFNETPSTLSTPARGEFRATIKEGDTIEYRLTWRNLESNVTQAHIHFGAVGLSGGISAWLCGTGAAGTPLAGPMGTPQCMGETAMDLTSGEASGEITAAQVVGPAGQGIAPGEFAELLAAIRAGATYANVHSVNRGPGEIRGQISIIGGGRH